MKIKYLLPFLFLVIKGTFLFAGAVDNATSMAAAKAFIRQLYGSGHPELRLVQVVENTCFIYGHDSGFVIISADDRVFPVLGYSTEHAFFVPDEDDTVTGSNFRSWLNFRKDQIRFLEENGYQADPTVISSWKDLLSGRSIRGPAMVINPLLTTEWGQLWPYNSMCPADPNGSGGHVAAGCGPLAIAQILRHLEYPEQGLGSYGYVSGSYPYSGADFGSATYQWDSMPNTISSVCDPVATIIYHMGVAFKAEWSPGGTTTGMSTIVMALVNYFRMDFASLRYVSRSAYTEAGWHSLLQGELAAGRPVYYQGFGTNGHAFVCDGVDDMNLYHFNWGWNGLYNGYYALNDLTPGNYNFTYGQGAIVGIMPNGGSTLDQNVTWSDSVVNHTRIAVPYAATLTVNPGTTIRFDPGCRLQVWGRVLSLSDSTGYSKFTATDTIAGWEGIDFHDDFDRMSASDSSKFLFTQIEFSRSAAIDCRSFGKVMLDHCRISNNIPDPALGYPGIRSTLRPVTVRNSEIFSNPSGGIYVSGSGSQAGAIRGNHIHHNQAVTGGGIFLINSMMTIENNTIDHNQASQYGGGVCVLNGAAIIRNNLFFNNKADISGGGIYLGSSNSQIANNLLANNSAGNTLPGSGGGVYCADYSTPVLAGNTIANNSAGYGGGIVFGPETAPAVRNSIIYGNQAVDGSQVFLEDYSTDPLFSHCDIQGGHEGFGGWGSGAEYDTALYTDNLDLPPQFILSSAGAGVSYDGADGDWTLMPSSPCIDAGDSAGLGVVIPYADLTGNPRYNGTIDMGAYEHHPDISPILTIDNDTIITGPAACFQALQSVTIGGTNLFTVMPGGEAEIRSGLKINMLPGARIYSGGRFLGMITPSGPWCPEIEASFLSEVSTTRKKDELPSGTEGADYTLYPNPVRDQLIIVAGCDPMGENRLHIRMMDLKGNSVSFISDYTGGRATLSLGQFPAGFYLIFIQQGAGSAVKKIEKL